MTTTETPHPTKGSRGSPGRRPAPRERVPVPEGRRTMPAGRVLIVMLMCLLVWGLLYAPSLKRSSEAQPLGLRRTVSMWVLTPLAAVSDVTQLTKLTDAASSALGRDPNAAPGGGVDVPPPDDLPSVGPGVSGSPTPTKPVTKSTPIRRPTAQDKLRVLVVGDSLAAGLGVYLEREFRPALVRVSRQGRISTGLSRPDYFDWPDALNQMVASYRPDLVIVMIGDNDNQGLQSPGGQLQTPIGTFQWPQAYQDRAEQFARIAVNAGAHVAWVGLPIVQDHKRWPLIQRQNDIYSSVATDTPNAVFVDSWDRFAGGDGDYTPYYHHDGKVELIRATDGVHFNPLGYEYLSKAVGDAIVQTFKLPPRALAN